MIKKQNRIVKGAGQLTLGLFMSLMVIYSVLPNYCNHEVLYALEQIPLEEETEKENEEEKKNNKSFDFISFSVSSSSATDSNSLSAYETSTQFYAHWLDVVSPPPELV